MARHCGRALHGVAAPRALINDCRCLFGLSTALPWPRAASQHQLSTPRAWLCGCSPGIQSAIQELGEAGGGRAVRSNRRTKPHTSFFSPFCREQQSFLCPLSSIIYYQGPEVVWMLLSSWVPSQMTHWIR